MEVPAILNQTGEPKKETPANVYAISFDGVRSSGLISEMLKFLNIFRERGSTIYADLGYDIRIDKGRYLRAYCDHDIALMPEWLKLDRITGMSPIEHYIELVQLSSQLARAGSLIHTCGRCDELFNTVDTLKSRILTTLIRKHISIILIENGTLPENPLFTLALQKALTEYLTDCRSHCRVFWRDHDLMWSSERDTNKYGTYPFCGVPKPMTNPKIQYIVLHEEDYTEWVNWCTFPKPTILPNTYDFSPQHRLTAKCKPLRMFSQSTVILRASRIIPQH
jgi:hypothetical protein